MAEEKIETGQELEKEKPLSLFDKKMKDLLDELDEHLEKIGGDYGPILMEELQNRLEIIVKKFNDEVHTLFTASFKTWKITDSQLREFIKSDIKIPEDKLPEKKVTDSSTPRFIKDVDIGPTKPK